MQQMMKTQKGLGNFFVYNKYYYLSKLLNYSRIKPAMMDPKKIERSNNFK